MPSQLIHDHGSSVGNGWAKGYPKTWDWSRDGGCYKNKRDFFSVHWEVRLERPPYDGTVRLHVESPRAADDASLNDVKREMIAALHASNMEQVAKQFGYQYKRGAKTSIADIQKNRCTEAFRVLLSGSQRSATHKEDMEAVHAALGDVVDQVQQKFHKRLKHHFQ